MYLLPAVDILDGRAVRLSKGDYHAVTVYNNDPVAQAQAFEQLGATWLHVVDLNGAKSGMPENAAIIERILKSTQLNVEVGGGLRSLEACERLYQAGVTRMVLGTALVRDPDFAQAAIERYGSMLTAGIDAKGGEVAVAGWIEGSGVLAVDLAARMADLGYQHLVYTDIARDGMQTGIEPAAYERMARAFRNPVIASGGVASLADIEALAPVAGCIEGIITGRAIYEGSLDVQAGVLKCAEVTAAYVAAGCGCDDVAAPSGCGCDVAAPGGCDCDAVAAPSGCGCGTEV